MENKVLILHGWGASHAPHWQAELASHIALNYGTVSFPLIQDFDAPIKSEWVAQIKAILNDFKPTTVVTHSLGSTLWFWLCQEDIASVEKLYLVAPPSMECDIKELDTFFPCPTPKNLKAKEAQLIASDNDHYMSIQEAQKLANTLGIELITIKDGGHLNSESGYGKWAWMEAKF